MATTETVRLEVVTPQGSVLDVQALSVQAPSVNGEFGVLRDHLPVLSALKCGLLTYIVEGKKKIAAIGPGFAEAGRDKVLVLTEMFVSPDTVKPDDVRKELAEAEDALKAFGERYEGPDYNELQRDVDWANARLEAYDTARAI